MDFQVLETENEVLEAINWVNKNSPYLVLDTETTSAEPRKAELVDIQFSGVREDKVYFTSGKHAKILEKISIPIVLHNFKYDLHVLRRHMVDLSKHTIYDTMLMSNLYDENRESHSLGSWVKELWNDDYKERFWTDFLSYPEAPLPRRIDYSCRDIIYTRRLFETLRSVQGPLCDHVHRFAMSLFETEYQGIKVDLDYLTNLGIELKTKIETMLPKMRELVEVEIDYVESELWVSEIQKRKTDKGRKKVPKPVFNFDSSKQLLDLCYGALGLPEQRNDKTKKPSVDDASLEKIKDSHPIIPLIQDYRGYKKIYGSFIEGTLERLDNGRIYPSFNINGTVTGRISSSNPNLQQLPRKGGVRGIYIPDPGTCLLSADYGQLEVCLAAHFSQDKNLLKIVLEGASQHDITAESLKIPRTQAKTLNFAMQYRCSAFKVAKILDISQRDAQDVWNKYWQTYSGLKRLMDECDKKVDSGEPIVNPFGRRRRFKVAKRQVWDPAYRQAFNSLIQGTGADLTNRAFTLSTKCLRERSIGKGLFVVHDEIIAQVKEGFDKEAKEVIVSTMKEVGQEIGLTIPLTVVCSDAQNRWED